MSCEQNAGQNNTIKIANKSSEHVAKVKNWGTVKMKIACMKKVRTESIQKIPAQFSPESSHIPICYLII
jgi:hypothetical protein